MPVFLASVFRSASPPARSHNSAPLRSCSPAFPAPQYSHAGSTGSPGRCDEPDVREITPGVIPDTGASTLVITEDVGKKPGLAVKSESFANIADGSRKPCKRTEPVEIRRKNRSAFCSAIVIDGSKVNLLGAVPLEDMDLRVNPVNLRLEGVRGDEPVHLVL